MARQGKVTEDLVALSVDDSPTVIKAIWSGTQAQYDAIATKDENTIYFIE